MITQSLKQFMIVHVLVTLLLAGGFALYGNARLSASVAAGSGLLLFSVASLAWVWWRVLNQKTVAWTTLIIVIKYAVLLASLYFFTRTDGLDVIGLGIGVGCFMISALIWALLEQRNARKEMR
jgi:hypothetical protein